MDRLTGEDEYYLTTLKSIVNFIHGMNHTDLKIDEVEYNKLVKNAKESIENEKIAKNAAASVELETLLSMDPNGSTSANSSKFSESQKNDTSSFNKSGKKKRADNDDLPIKEV